MTRKMIAAAAVLATWVAGAGTVHTYTTEQTVDEVISGDDSVVVSCPAGKIVKFTGANTFTGGTTISSGGVEIANRSALGTGAINCASGTYVNVSVSWRGQSTTLTEDVISKIVVAQPAAGEPWVAMRLTDDGLNNDVDFTGQPYLWLCGLEQKTTSSHKILRGIYEPCNNRYQFGYGGTQYNASYTGICVTNLVDAPNGDSRSVLCRGKGTTTLKSDVSGSKITFTGPVALEDGAYIAVNGNDAFGATKSTPSTKLVLREGTLLRSCAANISHNANFGLVVEGNATMHICGATPAEVYERFNGPFSGSGKLTVTDYGGIAFLGTNTTFTGTIKINGTVRAATPQNLYIGGGSNGVWNAINVEINSWPHGVVFTGDHDVVFSSTISGTSGRIIKQGKGTATIASTLGLSSSGGSRPFFIVKEGTLGFTAQPTAALSGPLEIHKGAVVDLGGLSWPSFALPQGEGEIVNWAGSLQFVNNSVLEASFKGWLAGDFEYTSTGTWTLQGTKDMGGMTVSNGKVVLAPGTVFTNSVSVGLKAEIDFAENVSEPTSSLTAEYWTAGDHGFRENKGATALEDAYNFKHDPSKTFNYTGDTAVFATCDTAAQGCLDTGNVDKSSDRKSLPILAGMRAAGSTATDVNYLAVCYSGYFIAPTNGTYRFDGHADDALSVWIDGVKVLHNTSGSIGGGDSTGMGIELTEGAHEIEVYFIDFTSAELFTLKVKTPLNDAPESLPLSMLSQQDYRHTAIADLTGNGRIGLIANGKWPETLGLTNFTGKIMVGAHTSGDVGKLTVSDATIVYPGVGSMIGGDWSTAGRAELVDVGGKLECSLVPGTSGNLKGFYNSNFVVPVDQPWTLDCDLYGTSPKNANSQYGDGFGVFLFATNGALPSASGGWGFGSPGVTCYGIQYYMMNGKCPTYWVKNGSTHKDVPNVVTNTYFHIAYFMDRKFHLRCEYDTSKMVSTLTDPGNPSKVFAMTNLLAGTELQSTYPAGARLGIWAACGAYYNCLRVGNLVFDDGRESGDFAFGGELELTGGTVNVVRDGTIGEGAFNPKLTVKGASTLNAEAGLTTTFGGSFNFDFSGGAPFLTFTGDFDFGSDPISVGWPSDPVQKQNAVADFSGVTGTKPRTSSFALASGTSSKWRFAVNGSDKLSIYVGGTLVLFR